MNEYFERDEGSGIKEIDDLPMEHPKLPDLHGGKSGRKPEGKPTIRVPDTSDLEIMESFHDKELNRNKKSDHSRSKSYRSSHSKSNLINM
jgi:hypothetical protein